MVDIHITQKDIDEWKREKAEYEAKLSEINRKLQFVELFVGAGPAFRGSEEEAPKTNLVLKVLSESKHPMKTQEIKEGLVRRGSKEQEWARNWSYLYQVLKRLVKSGRITKTGSGRFQLAANQPITPRYGANDPS